MVVTLHQINSTVADFPGNIRKILTGLEKARQSGSDLAVFPELCLTGYPPLDLSGNLSFVQAAQSAREGLLEATRDLDTPFIFGTLTPSETPGKGKPLHNSALLCRRGKVLVSHRKVLLPTYDVFDESRHFEPGGSLTRAGLTGGDLALSICEDIWSDKTFWKTSPYHRDPVEEFMAEGPLPLVNIAASPFSREKGPVRHEMLRSLARRHGIPILYVNQVGGNDSLVFDGRSAVIDPQGRTLALGASFAEDLLRVDLDAHPPPLPDIPPLDDLAGVKAALILGLRDYAGKCGFSSAVLGLSGGIDSSLTAVLAAEALGPENVLGVLMPSPFTSRASVEDAGELAANLGIRTLTIPIGGILESYLSEFRTAREGLPGGIVEENLQARIRGNILMALSNREGHLVLSTGNKSEIATGYCTLYGDMSGGLALISDLFKTEVYQLASLAEGERRVIPRRVFTRPPTAELKPGQKDEDTLPPYAVLDPILRAYIEEHRTPGEIAAQGFAPALVAEVLNRVEGNEYKRQQAAPGIRVTGKAFGLGRRYPIAKAKLF